MSEDKQQPVADKPKDEATPSSEGQGAPDELDALLAQYDEEAPKKTDEPKQDQQQSPEWEHVAFHLGKQEALKHMRGDLPESYDDLLFAYAESKARQDPRIAKAWANRFSDANGFAKVFSKIGSEARKLFRDQPDAQATEDRDAVSAAVRSASTRAADPEEGPSKKEIERMTDAEFFAFKRKALRG